MRVFFVPFFAVEIFPPQSLYSIDIHGVILMYVQALVQGGEGMLRSQNVLAQTVSVI